MEDQTSASVSHAEKTPDISKGESSVSFKSNSLNSVSNSSPKKSPEKSQENSQSSHPGRYFVIGLLLTVFNYGVYSILANLIIKNSDFLWLSTLISTLITAIVAYLAHSRITWKERKITKSAIYKFFIWNLIATFIFNPLLTQAFSLLTGLYDFIGNISENLNLNFSYDFIQSTGAFVLTGIVTMIINFLFYDKFVFGKGEKHS